MNRPNRQQVDASANCRRGAIVSLRDHRQGMLHAPRQEALTGQFDYQGKRGKTKSNESKSQTTMTTSTTLMTISGR
jgi:hypothetical protein